MSGDGAEIREDELQAFVDGRLDPRRHTDVLAHLGRHPEELARLVRYASDAVELRRRVAAVDAGGDDPTAARLQRELAHRLTERDRLTVPLYRAAAVALLLGAGWSGHAVYQRYLDHRLPPLVVEAAQAHQVFGEDAQRPVELTATSTAEMVAWFSRHLGESVEIPSLRAVGLRLVGGRLLPGEGGVPIAQLIYEDGAGHRLTLALSSDPTDVGPEIHLVEVQGLTAGYWQNGELAYAVVAETTERQLITIASEIGAREPDEGLL